MLITFFVLLSSILIALTGISFYLVRISQNKIDTYESWVVELQDDVNDVYKKMKFIDDRQLFEKDDDVGVVFNDLLMLIKKLNERTESNEENQETT